MHHATMAGDGDVSGSGAVPPRYYWTERRRAGGLDMARPAREYLTGLLEKTAIGDAAAFSKLYRSTRGQLMACASKWVRAQGPVEEIVQECYVSIWSMAGTFDRIKGTPLTWMYSIVRNRAIDHIRQVNAGGRSTLADCILDDLPTDAPGPEEVVCGRNLLHRLVAYIDSLPSKERDLIRLSFLNGLTHDEIARLRRLPLGTVKSNIRRGLQSLRARLESAAPGGFA